MIDPTLRGRTVLVTRPAEEAARLVALPGPAFLAALEQRIGYSFGALSLEDKPSAHPLRYGIGIDELLAMPDVLQGRFG